MGVIRKRYSCHDYRLYDTILRQEVAAIAYEVARECGRIHSYDTYGRNYFSDVNSRYPNNWAYRPINALAAAGYISTTRGYFRPERNITKSEALAILVDVAEISPRHGNRHYNMHGVNSWQQNTITTAYEHGIVNSYDNFYPNNAATRNDVFLMARRTLQVCSGSYNNYNDYHHYNSYGSYDDYHYTGYDSYHDYGYHDYTDYHSYDNYDHYDYHRNDRYYDDYYDYDRYYDDYTDRYDYYRNAYYPAYGDYYYDDNRSYYYTYDYDRDYDSYYDYDRYYDDYDYDRYYDDDYETYYYGGGEQGEVRIYVNIDNSNQVDQNNSQTNNQTNDNQQTNDNNNANSNTTTGTTSGTTEQLNNPVARDDSITTPEDTSVTIQVLGNDTDPQNMLDASTLAIIANPNFGTASISGDAITYNPIIGFSGNDILTYQICDVDGNCDTAAVTISVSGLNDTPVAVDDSVSTPENTAVVIDTLANDSDADTNNPTNPNTLDPAITITTAPTNGTTSINNANGEVTYTPNSGYSGNDVFVYQVCDTFATPACDTAIVTVTVDDAAPTAVDDTINTTEDTDAKVDLDANDTDPQNNLDPTTITITANPTNGTVTVSNTGVATYTPNTGYDGSDTFTYTICDATGLCDGATVAVTITPTNESPLAVNDSTTTAMDTLVTITVLSNDSDPDATDTTPNTIDTSSVTITVHPTNGSATVNGSGQIEYTPNTGFSGADTLTYQVCDTYSTPACDTATVTITIDDNTPDANDDTVTTDEDTLLVIDILANDTDPNNNLDATSVTITAGAIHGSTSINAVNGEISYTPDLNYNGSDIFTYQVCDTTALCDTASVDITVTAINDDPVAVDDTATTTIITAVVIDVLANDSDVDATSNHDPNDLDPNITITSAPLNGTTSINATNGEITYTPNAAFTGNDVLTYQVCDTASTPACVTANVAITVNP